MLESDVQRKLILSLEKQGWYVIKLIRTNKNGIPDLLCLKNGEAVFIEVKRQGQKPRPLQLFRLEELTKAGVRAFFTDNEKLQL